MGTLCRRSPGHRDDVSRLRPFGQPVSGCLPVLAPGSSARVRLAIGRLAVQRGNLSAGAVLLVHVPERPVLFDAAA